MQIIEAEKLITTEPKHARAPFATELHNLYWHKRWDGWLGEPIEYDIPVPTEQARPKP